MPRKKQTETPKVITLTQEQYKRLEEISGQIHQAKRYVDAIGDEGEYNERQVGFEAGKAYITLDEAEDQLDNILREIDPNEDEDEDDDY